MFALPSLIQEFELDCIGETTGQKYTGKFQCYAVLNFAQKTAVAREYTRYLGGYDQKTIVSELDIRADWLSVIKVSITSAPDWWKDTNNGDLILDDNVIHQVYEKIIGCKRTWRLLVEEKAKSVEVAKSEELPA